MLPASKDNPRRHPHLPLVSTCNNSLHETEWGREPARGENRTATNAHQRQSPQDQHRPVGPSSQTQGSREEAVLPEDAWTKFPQGDSHAGPQTGAKQGRDRVSAGWGSRETPRVHPNRCQKGGAEGKIETDKGREMALGQMLP